MKKILTPLLFSLFIIFFMALAQVVLAQPLPPSDKGATQNRQPNGNTAPIEGGLAVSLALVAGFGAWKFYKSMQKKREAIDN
jgi:hypothetical protein